jgi:hypothetical protein
MADGPDRAPKIKFRIARLDKLLARFNREAHLMLNDQLLARVDRHCYLVAINQVLLSLGEARHAPVTALNQIGGKSG